jgi:hypothetical protein
MAKRHESVKDKENEIINNGSGISNQQRQSKAESGGVIIMAIEINGMKAAACEIKSIKKMTAAK